MAAAFFDCFAGISGDMILGALIDLGLPLEVLERELRKLPVDGYRLQVTRVNKVGVMATKFDVILVTEEEERPADSLFAEVGHDHHHHDHHHHDHGHDHHHHHHHHHRYHHEHRSLVQILGLIDRSGLDPSVKELASRVFTRLGEAEAKVHGVPVEQIHFHEVGATDAIVDVVGAAIGLHYLGVDEVYASPVHLGQGMVKMAHGLYPIPGPATANLLLGVPTYQTDIRGELTTPTGAAILTAVARGYGPMPPLTISKVGYGAGTRDRSIPNVLRVALGQRASAPGPVSGFPAAAAGPNLGPLPDQHRAPVMAGGYHEGEAVMVETNIDDMNPQFYAYLFERLLDAGAMDLHLSPVQMKKNRPATVLHVLTAPEGVDRILEIIFEETTTIGVRTYPVTKRMLQRESLVVDTEYGPIRVKVSRLGARIVNVKPEYDDCLAAAKRSQVPLKLVDERAREMARGNR